MKHKKKLNFLISAGPTREPLDPIRFISNYATGYLGYELAKTAKNNGHNVILVSGQTMLAKPAGIKVIDTITAKEMLLALKKHIKWADCLIMSAAVSDFKPKKFKAKKLKKDKGNLVIEFTQNPDILKALKPYKKNKIYVGFALETHNLLKNAKKKLINKDLDVIVANEAGLTSNCFGMTKNTYYIMDNTFNCNILRNKSKDILSRALIDKSLSLWYNLIAKEKVD
jgi:phosphopantothenoylcysteine decarboxylase/phosphopantothenate--cysteine ligase